MVRGTRKGKADTRRQPPRAPENSPVGWEPQDGTPRYITSSTTAKARGPSVAVVISGAVTMLVGYVAAEGALSAKPHPLHWLVAVGGGAVGAVTGFIAGKLLSRAR